MGFGGLYISVTGLHASRKSLDTVSHNVANANNPNYVRQSAIHANNAYTNIGGKNLQQGTGVNVVQVRQIRDEFLDLKLRRETATFGYHYAKSQILEDIEGVFNEITSSGLQRVMDDFWNNWNELYKEPESLTMRGLVHESAVAFAETVSHLHTQLDDVKINLNKEILIKVDEINSTLKKIAEINQTVKLYEGQYSRMKANDLRDERNALLDRLSELMPVTAYENTYGETIVHLQGKELVSGGFINQIESRTNDGSGVNEGLAHLYFYNSDDKVDLRGLGELGGYIDVRDDSINYYMKRLDELVHTIAVKINDLHNQGTDLEGNHPGLDFFVGLDPLDSKDAAAFIRVNPDLYNLNKIAASFSGSKGDGEIAKEIYNLRSDGGLFDGIFDDEYKGMSPDDFYRDLILTLGQEREASRNIANNQDFLIKSIDDKRKSISQVSLDEEMADMIKFQYSYTANSRVLNAIDEMLETVVTRVGLVGR